MESRAQRRKAAPAADNGQSETRSPGSDAGTDAARRRFLKRAAAGGAIAFGATTVPLSALASAAFAQTTGSTTAGSTPGTATGTSLPGASGKAASVSGTDLTILVFAQTIEVSLIELYEQIVNAGKLSPADVQQCQAFALHHQDHDKEIATFLGSSAVDKSNPALLAEFEARINTARSAAELLAIADDLESGAAATYQWAMGDIADWQAAAAVATILPVEAQHAVQWSRTRTPDFATWAADIQSEVPTTQPTTRRWDPAKYPTPSN